MHRMRALSVIALPTAALTVLPVSAAVGAPIIHSEGAPGATRALAAPAHPAGEMDAAKTCAACIRLEPAGTSFTTGEGPGTDKPIYSVAIGSPEAGERLAAIWTPWFGMHGLDAVLWVRETASDAARWRQITLRRPKSPADILLFASRPDAFRDEVHGGPSILPGPFSRLGPIELAALDYVVSYSAGGTRALLRVGTTDQEVESLLTSLDANAHASVDTAHALP